MIVKFITPNSEGRNGVAMYDNVATFEVLPVVYDTETTDDIPPTNADHICLDNTSCIMQANLAFDNGKTLQIGFSHTIYVSNDDGKTIEHISVGKYCARMTPPVD